MCFPSISLPQDKIIWHSIFNFKTKLSGNDYFDLLEKIRLDERNLKDNLDRIQMIYYHILKEIYFWSSNERKTMKTQAKSFYLLTENDQWKLANDLYLYMEETNVYFDNKYKQLYVRRPWDSETTFIDLPNKLCQLLNIRGFEKNIRFLLKGTIEEIQKHFTTNSIEIPTKKDIVILERLSRSDVLQQSKPSATPSPKSSETTTSPPESNKSTSSIKNKETRSNKHEYTTEPTETFIDNSTNRKYTTDTVLALQQLNQGFPQYYPFSCSGNYVLIEIIA
ncbi:unnamed protein product [Rotaria sp. Silwood2]|nr:unnamed protein product [Rotaria sp. Silwood2]CAF4395465.1 unnamed protein product [Rotaria sp. Silwood2]